MNDSLAYGIGQSIPTVLFGCLFVFFFLRTIRSKSLSLRLANAALICGLAAFINPEITFGLTPGREGTIFQYLGFVRLGLGITGLVLGILALIYRRRDLGTGLIRPLLGSTFSVLHGMVGILYLLLTSSLYAPPSVLNDSPGETSTAWVYKSPLHGFQLTFPSNHWQEVKVESGVAFFVHRFPQMQVAIIFVKNKPKEDFISAKEGFITFFESSPIRKSTAKHQEGISSKGNLYVYSTGMDQSDKKEQVFVATSLVWCKEKGLIVQLIFEGMPKMLSGIGHTSEMEAFEKSAKSILLSAE